MSYLEIGLVVIGVLKWIVKNCKLFVKAKRIAQKNEAGEWSGWLFKKEEGTEFFCWRISGKFPELQVAEDASASALATDLAAGKVAEVGEVVCIGEAEEVAEFIEPWLDANFEDDGKPAKFICIAMVELDVLEGIFGGGD